MAAPFTIILHSSKTMKSGIGNVSTTEPRFMNRARELNAYVCARSTDEITSFMHVSPKLAGEVAVQAGEWLSGIPSPAIDSFIGDIYSGFRAAELSDTERAYAQKHLVILSGLYGVLSPLDGVVPYRFEMGYSLPGFTAKNAATYWGDSIAAELPSEGYIINTSSAEYMKVILPFVDAARVITPQFLTVNKKTGEPGFTAVHSKIARGAFARWLIQTGIQDPHDFFKFHDLGYEYNETRSTLREPVYICKDFKGIGLSVRLV